MRSSTLYALVLVGVALAVGALPLYLMFFTPYETCAKSCKAVGGEIGFRKLVSTKPNDFVCFKTPPAIIIDAGF